MFDETAKEWIGEVCLDGKLQGRDVSQSKKNHS
jgi:hypothetical protein